MTPALITDLTDGILTVRLNRPQTRNSQDPALWRELAAVGAGLDPAVRAVVLSAEGLSFSAGLDRRMLTPEGIPGEGSLPEFAAMPPAELSATIATFQQAFSWWRRSPVVTVAAVGGHAVGAGFQLALACDLMVVADDVQLSMKEPSLGLVPDLGGTLPLVEAVGYSRALELVVSGRWIGADEAVRIGLALSTVPRDSLDDAAREIARIVHHRPSRGRGRHQGPAARRGAGGGLRGGARRPAAGRAHGAGRPVPRPHGHGRAPVAARAAPPGGVRAPCREQTAHRPALRLGEEVGDVDVHGCGRFRAVADVPLVHP